MKQFNEFLRQILTFSLSSIKFKYILFFQKRSHRADEYIRLVKNELDVAVKQCIEAAGYEFDTSNQKMLIRVRYFQFKKK